MSLFWWIQLIDDTPSDDYKEDFAHCIHRKSAIDKAIQLLRAYLSKYELTSAQVEKEVERFLTQSNTSDDVIYHVQCYRDIVVSVRQIHFADA